MKVFTFAPPPKHTPARPPDHRVAYMPVPSCRRPPPPLPPLPARVGTDLDVPVLRRPVQPEVRVGALPLQRLLHVAVLAVDGRDQGRLPGRVAPVE